MLLIKKKVTEQPFIIADIKDEEEGIKSYSRQIKELEAQGKKKEADKIRKILRQEKQHRKILLGIKYTQKSVIVDGKLLIRR